MIAPLPSAFTLGGGSATGTRAAVIVGGDGGGCEAHDERRTTSVATYERARMTLATCTPGAKALHSTVTK